MAHHLGYEPDDAKPDGAGDHRSSSAKIISTNGGEEIKEQHACVDRWGGHRAAGAKNLIADIGALVQLMPADWVREWRETAPWLPSNQ
jgi:hypothetical protein